MSQNYDPWDRIPTVAYLQKKIAEYEERARKLRVLLATAKQIEQVTQEAKCQEVSDASH